MCVYILCSRRRTHSVHFYPNSSQNYPSIVICVCHTSDRHRIAFVTTTNHFLCLSHSHSHSYSQSHTQSFFRFSSELAPSFKLYVGLSLGAFFPSLSLYKHAQISSPRPNRKLKGLLQHCESSKGFISQYLFRILIAAQLHSRLLCMSCSSMIPLLRYAGVSDHTRTHIFLHICITPYTIRQCEAEIPFLFCHPIFFFKPLPSTYRKLFFAFVCAESNSNISFHLYRVYVCLFAIRVLDTHIHYISVRRLAKKKVKRKT